MVDMHPGILAKAIALDETCHIDFERFAFIADLVTRHHLAYALWATGISFSCLRWLSRVGPYPGPLQPRR